uniref:Uncharacterized protein n=1 Tax=Chaetoceros debilis TaxID=122233 RepID=A0A6S8SRL2_9STRA
MDSPSRLRTIADTSNNTHSVGDENTMNNFHIDRRYLSPVQECFSEGSVKSRGSILSHGSIQMSPSSTMSPSVPCHRTKVSAFSSLADLKAQQREISNARNNKVTLRIKNDAGTGECVMTVIPEAHYKNRRGRSATAADFELLGLPNLPPLTRDEKYSTPTRPPRPSTAPTYLSSNGKVSDRRDDDDNLNRDCKDGESSRMTNNKSTGGSISLEQMDTIRIDMDTLPNSVVTESTIGETVGDKIASGIKRVASPTSSEILPQDDSVADDADVSKTDTTKKENIMMMKVKKKLQKPLKLVKKVFFKVGKKASNRAKKVKAFIRKGGGIFTKKEEIKFERSPGYLL